jgi:hypothetical protein
MTVIGQARTAMIEAVARGLAAAGVTYTLPPSAPMVQCVDQNTSYMTDGIPSTQPFREQGAPVAASEADHRGDMMMAAAAVHLQTDLSTMR